jgi:hypothetical protein
MANHKDWPTQPERLQLLYLGWMPPENATRLLGAASLVDHELHEGERFVSLNAARVLRLTLEDVTP